MKANQRKNSGKNNSLLIAVILVFAAALTLGIMVARFQSMQDAKLAAFYDVPTMPMQTPVSESEPTPMQPTPEPTMSPEEIKAMEEAALAEAAARKAEASKYSFYQKLANGFGTNILILGDKSAMDPESDGINGVVDGKKFSSLSRQLEEKYLAASGEKVTISNLANVNGNLLGDVMRINSMPDDPSYDLVILSYGINDQKNDVITNFEALILSLQKKFPDCSIICTVEPCFHGMTNDLETMVNESNTFGIPVINLFSAFYDKGSDVYFDFFEKNQIVPNEKGTEEWIRLICETIDTNAANSTGKMSELSASANKARELTRLSFIPVSDPRLTRKDDTSYTLDLQIEGLSYIQHKEMLGKDNAKVIADNILYSFGKPGGAKTPEGGYITLIYENLISEKDFTITFTSKELADGLEGFYLLEKTEEEK